MAVIHRKKNTLEKKIKNIQKIYVAYIITLIILIFIYFPLALLTGLIGNLVFGNKFIEMKKYKKGLIGEERTLATLSKLDNTYHIFNDIKVTFDRKSSQLDLVVVGDNGITVVESKNINGMVEGSIYSEELTIRKVGKSGGVYYKSIYNPYKQVKTHVYRLGNFLKKNKIRIWVTGVVFFQPKDAFIFKKSVNVSCSEGVFFYKERELLKYIKEKNNYINSEDKEKIIEYLKAL